MDNDTTEVDRLVDGLMREIMRALPGIEDAFLMLICELRGQPFATGVAIRSGEDGTVATRDPDVLRIALMPLNRGATVTGVALNYAAPGPFAGGEAMIAASWTLSETGFAAQAAGTTEALYAEYRSPQLEGYDVVYRDAWPIRCAA